MIRVFDDPASLADAAAGQISRAARDAIAVRGAFRIALSGGSAPLALYRVLGAAPRLLDWKRVTVLFADERAVPPDDPESNYRLVREILIDPLGATGAAPHVERMSGEAEDLDEAARDYERFLEAPLDFLSLGIGSDGHTASLFPGGDEVRERERRVLAVRGAPKPPSRRITIAARVIAEARQAQVLAMGAEKAAAVASALEPGADPTRVPAALARGASWLLDRAAAASL